MNIKHNFIICPVDTDSISMCKSDMTVFTDEEQTSLLNELNSISPEYIIWEHDGFYPSCIALKAKNYILYDGEKKIVKGSAFKTSSKEPALRNFMDDMVDEMLNNNSVDALINIYHKYIKESQNIQDISRWVTKKTITKTIFESERANETKVLNAIKGEKFQEGDKIFIFNTIEGEKQKIEKGELVFLKDGTPKMIPNKIVKLQQHWSLGIEDKEHYLSRVYDTLLIMENVIDITKFVNYTLKKNKQKLEELLNEI